MGEVSFERFLSEMVIVTRVKHRESVYLNPNHDVFLT